MRKNGDKIGNAFILLTKNTQEVVWFQKMTENLSEFDLIYCKDIEECIQKYKENN